MFSSADTRHIRYMFIDFNAFFASVEQHDDSALRGRPVIVTPLKSEHSGAIAASYEAKAFGIGRGTSVKEARRLCPAIAVKHARHDRYVAVHHLLMREIERHVPIARICSIDECLCLLDRREADVTLAREKAMAVKEGIACNVGPALRASIGLAPSPLLAKLAGELVKPDGLTVIEGRMLPAALAKLPLRAIPGIGEGMEGRLARAGVTDFLSLWALQPKQARALWGSVVGERFLYALHGHDVSEEQPSEKRMIGHSRVLSGAYRDPDGAKIVARALILKAASRLRHYHLHAGGMHLLVKLAGGGAYSHEAVLRPTQNSWRLLRELDAFWPQMVTAVRRHRGPTERFKLVSCYLHRLHAGPPPADLFIPQDADEADAREAALWNSIDALNRRYGGQKVVLCSQRHLDLNYLGVKIAFSRVPEIAEFEDAGGLEAMIGSPPHVHGSSDLPTSRALY